MSGFPRDVSDRLGIQKMPPGYQLWLLDSGHYMWSKEDKDESAIHWNRWAVYHWAWHDYRSSRPRFDQFGHMSDVFPFLGTVDEG